MSDPDLPATPRATNGGHPPVPAVVHSFDPIWLRTLFLCNARDALNVPIRHILRRCQLIQTEAQLFKQEGFVPELVKIKEMAEQLLACFNSVEGMTALATPPVADPSPVAETNESVLLKNIRSECGSVLVAESDLQVAGVMVSLLEQNGHAVSVARTGPQAVELVYTAEFDLILLDLKLPEMDGFTLLEYLKGDMVWRHVPVIVVSEEHAPESLMRCFELGADDFLPRPFDPVLLLARVNACIEKRRFREKEQNYLDRIQAEQARSERLLLNILPVSIADRLKQGEDTIVDSFGEVTVLFADLVGFTQLSTRMTKEELVRSLNDIFSAFDRLAERRGLEKIKTIGDAYMVAGGLPQPNPDHAEAVANMALDMQQEISRYNVEHGTQLSIRVGINTGPVVAGIIGKYKFIYDLWGDTVNTASRMESHGSPGTIQVTETTYAKLKAKFRFVSRGSIDVKGKGGMNTYWLLGKTGSPSA